MTTRALVLSGGGAVGIAWQTGLAAGLASKGVDLADADAIVGTSAGSATGAQLGLRFDMAERVERYRQRAGQEVRGTVDGSGDRENGSASGNGKSANGQGGNGQSRSALGGLMQAMRAAQDKSTTTQERLAMIGAYALQADTGPEDRFIESFQYLDGHDWPDHFRCTAVDAATGEFVVWDKAAGVPLVLAVASSCAVPGIYPPITIGGRRYVDGGMRSGTNADLASGHDLVLIVGIRAGAYANQTSGDPAMQARAAQARARLEREQEALRSAGARVLVTGPDEGSAAAFGSNLLSGANLAEIAEQGARQGAEAAADLGEFWLS